MSSWLLFLYLLFFPMIKDLVKDMVMKQVANQIEKKTGINSDIIEKVTDEGLGSLIFGLAKNNEKPEATKGFFDAITEDHDGSILDNIDSLFGEDKQTEGNKILDHILGNKKESIETQIGKDTGI